MTLSSAEAELMALSSGMAESLHLQQLIEELQTGMCTTTFSYNNNKKCITLYTDSTSATSLASKLGVNRRSRHIALRYLWTQDLRQAGEVDIKRVTTHENPADIYMKLLPAPTLPKHLTSKWSSSTTRRRGGRRVHVLPQEQEEGQQGQKH